ncbi:hypothetical protein MASR2M15_08300 [Anaerolineales bacterium]
MAELPYHLKRFEPVKGALEILTFLADEGATDIDVLCDELDLSDRTGRKAIRRLATTGYVQMVGDYVYDLTTKGSQSVEELNSILGQGIQKPKQSFLSQIERELILAIPQPLIANKTANVFLGFNEDIQESLSQPVELVLRVSAVNGIVNDDNETILELNNDQVMKVLQFTPQSYHQARLKVQAFQLSASGEDINEIGGMYVDLDVVATSISNDLVAYQTPLHITEYS